MEHPEEPDQSIEGIVPLRESPLNVLSEAIRKRDAPGRRPTERAMLRRGHSTAPAGGVHDEGVGAGAVAPDARRKEARLRLN